MAGNKNKSYRWVILAGVLVFVGWLGYKAWRVTELVRSVQAHVSAAQALNAGGDLPDGQTVRALVHGVRADVVGLKAEAGWPIALAPWFGWVPEYGGDLAAVPQFFVMADELTAAAEAVIDPLAPLLDITTLPEGEARVPAVVGALAGAHDALLAADAHIVQAQAARATLDSARLSARVGRLVARYDEAAPLLALAVRGGVALPELVGWDAPRTYLILAQNDDELRATGGFITAVGTLRIERGQVSELDLGPSYAVDDFSQPYPEAPEALRRAMGIDLLVLRDSNWSPDFPTSARQAMDLYTLTRPGRLDGVIAADQRAAQALVAALGPLTLEGFDQPITGDTVIPFMRQAWGAGRDGAATTEWAVQHKNFIPQLARALLARVQTVQSAGQAVALAKAVLGVLNERHVLVYLPDSPLAPVLAEHVWDGALPVVAGDSLLVSDWNAGYNKVNPNIEAALTYRVTLGATPQARVTVTYTNRVADAGTGCPLLIDWGPSYEEQTQRCYWNYLRVFAPAGSVLLESAVHSLPADARWDHQTYTGTMRSEVDLTVRAAFGTLLLVPRGSTVATWVTYRLPERVVSVSNGVSRYTLYVQKQAGTGARAFTVVVDLPPGAQVVRAEPVPAVTTVGGVTWTSTLETDRTLWVEFK